MSAIGTDSGLIGQYHLTFKLDNKYCTDKFIVLWDMWRDLILGLNWQFNYKISCISNINGHQYMTHNNNYLCTSKSSTKATKPLVWNTGIFYLQPRSVSIITVQAPTVLKPHHIYKFSASNDLPLGLIPLAVNHKINHNYLKLLSISTLSTVYSRVYVPGSAVLGTLKPIEKKMQRLVIYHGQKSRNLMKTLWTGQKNCITAHTLTMNTQLYHCSQVFNLKQIITLGTQ